MEKVGLKEVKAHFENAKVVKCLVEGTFDLTKVKVIKGIHELINGYYIDIEDDCIKVFGKITGRFAEILESKDSFGTKYTKEQLLKHGDLILEYLRNPEIEIEFQHGDSWLIPDAPLFFVEGNYRKKPAVIFTNEIGEEFTQEDLNSNILVYWLGLEDLSLCSDFFYDILPDEYVSKRGNTSISKTKLGALKLAVKQLENK